MNSRLFLICLKFLLLPSMFGETKFDIKLVYLSIMKKIAFLIIFIRSPLILSNLSFLTAIRSYFIIVVASLIILISFIFPTPSAFRSICCSRTSFYFISPSTVSFSSTKCMQLSASTWKLNFLNMTNIAQVFCAISRPTSITRKLCSSKRFVSSKRKP